MLEELNVIIRKAQAGDKDAVTQLLQTYTPLIESTARTFMRNEHDTNDAVQESMIKIYLNLPKFAFRSSFSSWLYRVTANMCKDMLRRNRPMVDIESLAEELQSSDALPEDAVVQNETRHHLKTAIEQLPETHMPIVVMYYIEGRRFQEISTVLGIPEATARSRMARSKKKLRTTLQEVLAG